MAVPRFGENEDIIDIRMDNVFKAVFTRDTRKSQGALARFLSAVIGREVEILELKANEPAVDSLRDRQIRFDINCKARRGELMNVEMSLNPGAYEPVRLEFHAGKLFTGQDIRGAERSYNDLHEAYQVAILAKGRFFPDREYLHRFEYYDAVRGIGLGGRSRIITLELSKLGKVAEKPVGEMTASEHWGMFFRYATDRRKRETINEILEREEGIAMAGEVLSWISRDEIERAQLMSEYKYELDTQSRLVTAQRKGMKQGLAKGRKQGLERGMKEGVKEAARRMKAAGLSAGQIEKYSGLSRSEIEEL
jgi:predicted transposase/invertase (TIGR01784 family)